MRVVTRSFLALIAFHITLHANYFTYYPFKSLMDFSAYPTVFRNTQHVLHYDGYALYKQAERLYESLHPLKTKDIQAKPIPKIIHQIWIGSSLPDVFKPLMETWKKHHPDWEYMLWDDAKVQQLFPLHNQHFYDATDSMGVKSDLLKWEIVYRFGGVYVDVDFECLHSLDQLHLLYDFYTALQPFDAFFVQLGAALFAAHPGHPILKHCIETIKDDWHEKGAPKKSGPVHFSKSFLAVAGCNNSRDIAFPAFYFYPLGSKEKELQYAAWIEKGAYAVHHWAMSWMPRNTRRSQFRTFDNEQSSKVWND